MEKMDLKKPEGKLGVLVVGVGAPLLQHLLPEHLP